MDKVNYMELRLLIKEYHYYHGEFPLLKEIYETYKAKFNYTKRLIDFGKDLSLLRKQGCLMRFVELDNEHTYMYKGKPKTVKSKVKRIIIR